MEGSILKRTGAEAFGTFWLVLGGVGSAVLAAKFPGVGIGIMGVSTAFGLTLLTMAYAIGNISGCHLNPAVSVGLCLAGRLPRRDLLPYIVAQIAGALVAAIVVYALASGRPGFTVASSGLGANGYGAHSPGGYSLGAGLLAEIVLTAGFVFVILAATDKRAPLGFAPIPIGLALMLANLVAIPLTNASINPARSTGPALVMGGWALKQLWLFWVAPIIGGAFASVLFSALYAPTRERRRELAPGPGPGLHRPAA
jgi:aquaporin Z